MTRDDVVQKERVKLLEIFADTDPKQRTLLESLIEDAAFLVGENYLLKDALSRTGMVKIHPTNIHVQKAVPAASQYLKNLSAYTIVVKTLSTILNRQTPDDDDDGLGDYE